ncbi:MAG: hypothetical protein WCF24_03770 [Acidimicrobiales bacterium]
MTFAVFVAPWGAAETRYLLAMSGTLEESRRAPAGGQAIAAERFVGQESAGWGRRRGLFVALIALVAFVALSAFLYLVSTHAFLPDSDGATVVLEGNAIIHGDVALHGWSLSYDSFWLLDALYYAVALAIVGIHGYLLHLIPAIIAALVVVAGALIARDGQRGLVGLVGAGVVIAVLALPTHLLAYFFLRGPLHVDTVLCALIAFIALKDHRFDWRRWVVAVVFLAAGALGDLQVLALGTIPLFLGGAAAALRARRVLVALASTTAAVASVVIALIVREITKTFGAFALIKPNPRAPYSMMFGANLKLAGHYFANLVGVGSSAYGNGGAPTSFVYAHAVVLVLIGASLVLGIVSLVKALIVGDTGSVESLPRSTMDDFLVLGALGGLVVFLALTTEPIFAYGRYLVPSLIFGVILMARYATRLAAYFARSRDAIPRVIPLVLATAAVAVAASLASATGFELAQTKPFDPYAKLATFLERHHLHEGLGDYWTSSIVTVESDNGVVVRPITAKPNGTLVRYDRESDASWYAGHHFQFLALNPTLNFGNVNVLTATSTFGKPIHVWIAYGLEILVWRHPITVSSQGIT